MRACTIAILGLALTGLLGSCQVCEPGETQSCTCGQGVPGTQVCAEDGASWGDCDCSLGDDDDTASDDDDTTPGDDDDTTSDDDDTTPGDDDDTSPVDADGDGWDEASDCDDTDATIHPGATEACNGVDDDCDSAVDEGCPGVCDAEVPGDYAAISSAVSGVVSGGTICVAPGTYYEELEIDREMNLVGTGGSALTIIEASSGSVIEVASGYAQVQIQGFTLTGGWANQGGGIYSMDSSLTLVDVALDGNVASNEGGGIYSAYTFLDLSGCALSNNDTGQNGGGLYVEGGSLDLRDSRFIENFADCPGGGVYLWTNATLDNVLFSGNEASAGGAISIPDETASLNNVFVIGNLARVHNCNGGYYGGSGGGIYISDVGAYSTTEVEMTNVVVAGNDATDDGGGIYTYEDIELQVSHSVVVHNTAGGEGAGLFLDDNDWGYTTLSSSIVAWNGAGASGGGIQVEAGNAPDVLYCDTWSNTPSNFEGMTDPTGTNGNLSIDPEFLDMTGLDPLAWDLHLASTSSAVDAGDPAVLDNDGSGSDMGAFGGPSAGAWDLDLDGYPDWWQVGPYDGITYPGLGLDCDDRDETLYPGSGC